LKTRWVLTQEAFDRLLAHFDEDSERAAEQYEFVRERLVRLFRYRGCTAYYELADETINRVARKIAEGALIPKQEVTNYFYGVARNVLREHLRSPENSVTTLGEPLPSDYQSENPEERLERLAAHGNSERRFNCLDRCLDGLAPETRKLLLSYYEGEEGAKVRKRHRLAKEIGISLNTLRIRLHRIRAKLEACVSGCMNYGNEG
jgi:RNA polymerase sigma factor (sigma-70 family)